MTHADNFPTVEQYTVARRCPTCEAAPGEMCDRGAANRFHARRIDGAVHHRIRDIGKAPDAREPGVRYDTEYRGVKVP